MLQLCQMIMLDYPVIEDTIGSRQPIKAMVFSKTVGKTSSGDKSEYQTMIPHKDVSFSSHAYSWLESLR